MAWLSNSKSKKKKILICIVLFVFVVVGNYPITRGAIGQIIDNLSQQNTQINEPDVVGGKIVLDYGAEIEEVGRREGIYRSYSYPKYYKDDNDKYQLLDTTIQSSSRAGYDWEVTKGVYNLWVSGDGTYTFRHLDDERSFRLSSVVIIDQNSGKELAAANINLSSLQPIISDNSIEWSLPNGLTYKIEYGPDTLRDIIIIPEILKDILKVLVPPNWSNAAIGFKYETSVEQQGTTIELPKDERQAIIFRDIQTGNVIHRILPGIAEYDDINPTEDNLIDPALYDKFVRRKTIKDGSFYDYVSAEAFDVDTKELKFNSTVSFGDRTGPADYTGTQDTWLGAYYSNRNRGTNVDLDVGSFNFLVQSKYTTLLAFDLDTFEDAHPNAVVTAVTLKLYANTKEGNNQDVYIMAALREWGVGDDNPWSVYEGGVADSIEEDSPCWTYAQYTEVSWANPGALASAAGYNGDDPGDYDGAPDRGYLPLATVSVTGVGEKTFNFTDNVSLGVDVVQTQLDNVALRYGFVILGYYTTGHNYILFTSSEGAAAQRPWMEITYTEDTCTCQTGQDWSVDSSDNCYLATDCDLDKNTLYLMWTGSGAFNIIDGAALSLRKIESTSTPINVEASSGVKINFK